MEGAGEGFQGNQVLRAVGKVSCWTQTMSHVESDTWNLGKVSAEYKNLKEYMTTGLNKQFL